MKQNCWEFKKCGREMGGRNVKELGVCPAATSAQLHGSHGGKLGGRACWIIDGTMCNGQVQGAFAQKFKSCAVCDFYQAVKAEEKNAFKLSVVLLARLKGEAIASRRQPPGARDRICANPGE